MTRKKERKEELTRLPWNALIDRILDYPDQDLLNRNPSFQVGEIAEGIREAGYKMTKRQHDTLLSSFVDLTNKQVLSKEQELEGLSKRELIERICSYPDQARLNYSSNGEKEPWPLGERAERIRDKDCQMTSKQYRSLLRSFAERTANETCEMEQAHARRLFPEAKAHLAASTLPIEEGQTVYYQDAETPAAIGKEGVLYEQEYGFVLDNCFIERQEARDAINQRLKELIREQNLAASLNDWLKEFSKEPAPEVTAVDYAFTSETEGHVRIQSNGPMSYPAIQATEDWIMLANFGPVKQCLNQFTEQGLTRTSRQWDPSFRIPADSFQKQQEAGRVSDLTLTEEDLAGLEPDKSIQR